MTVEPPSLAGGVHEKVNYVEVMLAVISIKPVGGSGIVGLIVSENVKLSF